MPHFRELTSFQGAPATAYEVSLEPRAVSRNIALMHLHESICPRHQEGFPPADILIHRIQYCDLGGELSTILSM